MSNEYDEYIASQKSYSEMVAIAKDIHPDMKVRLVDENSWEIYLSTDKIEKTKLSETYKNTAAWDLANSYDSGYGDALLRYRWKNGMSNIPIEGVAEYINLGDEQYAHAKKIQEKMFIEQGVTSEDLDFLLGGNSKDLTDEDVHKTKRLFKIYEDTVESANKQASKDFKDKWELFNSKWEF